MTQVKLSFAAPPHRLRVVVRIPPPSPSQPRAPSPRMEERMLLVGPHRVTVLSRISSRACCLPLFAAAPCPAHTHQHVGQVDTPGGALSHVSGMSSGAPSSYVAGFPRTCGGYRYREASSAGREVPAHSSATGSRIRALHHGLQCARCDPGHGGRALRASVG